MAELQEQDFKGEIGLAWKAHGKGQNFNDAVGKKGVYIFPEYIQEKCIRPFWPTKQAHRANQHYNEVSLLISPKGHLHKV